MTIKDAIYRELKYNLCGSGGLLDGLVAADHVQLDVRPDIDANKDPADYPWVIFSRASETGDNKVGYTRDRYVIEVIGLLYDADKGDALLEQVKGILKRFFRGKMKTIGKYTAAGVADPNGGLKLACEYINTVEGYDHEDREKMHMLQFAFSYLDV